MEHPYKKINPQQLRVSEAFLKKCVDKEYLELKNTDFK